MKKIRSLKFILILIFVMFLAPKDVFAENVTRAFTGSADWYQQQGYYYGLPDSHNRMPGGYLIDETQSKSFPSNGSYYFLRPIDTNVNFIYGLKQLTLNSNVSVESNRVYTIQLILAGGSYIRYGYQFDTSLYNISNDSVCYSNIGACSYNWDNGSIVITFAPTQSSSSYYIRLGNQANDNKALALNTYTMGMQGIEIRSASIRHNNDVVDVTPIVNQQIMTNQKLEDVKNSINSVGNKIDSTNEKLDDTNEKLDDTNDKLDTLNDTLTDDSTSGSDTALTDYIENYDSTDDTGITRLITAPLRLIQAFTTAQCSPLEFQLPIIHNQVSLACPRPMYQEYFGVFFSLWQLITTGLIAYNVGLNIYSKVRAMSNPNNDRIEVLNL